MGQHETHLFSFSIRPEYVGPTSVIDIILRVLYGGDCRVQSLKKFPLGRENLALDSHLTTRLSDEIFAQDSILPPS